MKKDYEKPLIEFWSLCHSNNDKDWTTMYQSGSFRSVCYYYDSSINMKGSELAEAKFVKAIHLNSPETPSFRRES